MKNFFFINLIFFSQKHFSKGIFNEKKTLNWQLTSRKSWRIDKILIPKTLDGIIPRLKRRGGGLGEKKNWDDEKEKKTAEKDKKKESPRFFGKGIKSVSVKRYLNFTTWNNNGGICHFFLKQKKKGPSTRAVKNNGCVAEKLKKKFVLSPPSVLKPEENKIFFIGNHFFFRKKSFFDSWSFN